MFTHTAKQIKNVVLASQRVLLIPHQKPDGDALGAATAFAEWLESLGKEYIIFCATDFSTRLSYLPHTDKLTSDTRVWQKPIDTIVVFDSGDLVYAGVAEYIAKLSRRPIIINIDHHITNEKYGDYNLLLTGASSTSEILYHFFTITHVPINISMATSLLTGIITDTDTFTNAATSARAIHAAGELIAVGGNFDVIKNHIYKSTPLRAFELWGRIFSRLSKHEKLNLVYTYLTHKDLIEFGLTESDVEGMTNFLNSISDGHAGMILKELPDGKTKGSFRTTRDDVDVAKMAKHFGGGGHKKAAGFTVEKPIHEAIEHVLEELEKLFPQGNMLEPVLAE